MMLDVLCCMVGALALVVVGILITLYGVWRFFFGDKRGNPRN